MNDQRYHYVIAPVMLLPCIPIAASAVAFAVGNRKCHIAIVNRIAEAGRQHLIKFCFLLLRYFLYTPPNLSEPYPYTPSNLGSLPAQSLLLVPPQTISA